MRAMLILGILTLAVPDRPDPTPMQPMPVSLTERLAGDWSLVKHLVGGTDTPPNGLTMVFTREAMQQVYVNDDGTRRPAGTYKFTLDTTKSPARISFRETRFEAILKIEGDTLTMCFSPAGNAEPPATFESVPNSGISLLVANRVKK